LTLAEYIKELRKNHKVDKPPTLEDVAIGAELSLSCIHNIEAGVVTKPSIDTLKALAKYYEVPLQNLVEKIN
jgi:transcriptional regulator with XRE-family HTH domain